MTTIGYYSKNAYCYKTDTLYELTDVNFSSIISSIPVCTYDKTTQKNEYTNWKKNNLPIVFFTLGSHRPDDDNSALHSGYAVIDIDTVTDERIVTNHPAVVCMNYTGGGTHIFIHSNGWGLTPLGWQQTYNKIAYEIWCELKGKYGNLQFDGSNAKHTQGCFLWNTQWASNSQYDCNYTESDDLFITDSIIEQMYTKGTYKKSESNTVKNYNAKSVIARNVEQNDEIEIFTTLAERSKLSDDIKEDFATMERTAFLRKYEPTYSPITGTRPNFTMYKDYEGNIYYMYKTNGEMVKLWQPVMQNKKNLAMKDDGKLDYEIKVGGRRRSLYAHLLQAAQFLDYENKMDPDHLLYDAVYWIANYCENGLSFPKKEILSTVDSVLLSYKMNDDRMHYDKRTFVSGKEMIDSETGEIISMDKKMKLKANAKCRKTERITDVIKQWKPEMDIEWNVEHIKSWEEKSTKNLKEKTFINYIECAKMMPELVEQFPWLEEFEVEKKSVGRQTQSITIKNVETNETHQFESKTECMQWLGISKPTFSKFLQGHTKLNKTFQVI